MSYRNLPVETQAERWMDQREIQNLMGRYIYYVLLRRENRIYDKFWCREAADPCYGVNDGYYKGEEAIRGLYDAQFANGEIVSEHMKAMFPEFLSKYSRQELHGVGSLNIDALCSPVVFVAEDGMTAKGVWCVMGIENDIYSVGPYSMLNHGYMLGDFVNENGEWRIWHLVRVDELDTPVAKDWTGDCAMPEDDPRFIALKSLSLPEPNISCTVYEKYSVDREPMTQLRFPVPYRTFAETFSYGV